MGRFELFDCPRPDGREGRQRVREFAFDGASAATGSIRSTAVIGPHKFNRS